MTADWPAWATEELHIAAHDPAWARLAGQLARDLDDRLAPLLDGRVEHIGSTAVAGLPAKPIVDLMAPVASLAPCGQADRPLEVAGWQLVPPDLDGRSWRRFYVLPDGDRRVAHLQLVERAHPRWGETIAFRDALRREPSLAAAYADVKRAAAAAHPEDREAYTAAKAGFVRRAVQDG